MELWENTLVKRKVTPASIKYRFTWKSAMVLMMEKQSITPNPQALKESSFARYNFYSDIFIFLWSFCHRLFANVQFVIYKHRFFWRISFKKFNAETHVHEISVDIWENYFAFIFFPQPLILKLRITSQLIFETLCWESHFRRYNQPLSRV